MSLLVPGLFGWARRWLSEKLAAAGRDTYSVTHCRLALICASIFLLAFGVRLLHWQDRRLELTSRDTLRQNVARQYRREAMRMLTGGGILFPKDADPSNALIWLHPPGYCILMATVFKFYGESESVLRLIQIICDGFAAILAFLIAAEILALGAAYLAGTLVALSPHLAHYSLNLSPDSLAVLPILLAVYLLVRAIKQPGLIKLIAAGISLGLSFWLRSNALLLAPLFAIVMPLSAERATATRNLRWAITLVAATVITISPIIIRNWIVFHQFAPMSVPTGLNLIQGIAEFDEEGRFAMPRSDPEALQKDVEWHNRPEYARNLWSPDGIERDRARLARGLQVVRSNPRWFIGTMLRRAAFMLSYNDSQVRRWPFNTATIPVIRADPPFGHSLTQDEAQTVWFNSPAELAAGGSLISPQAEVSLSVDKNSLRVFGDDSGYDDQFASAPIGVQQKTDYVIRLSAKLELGNMAVKVTDEDRRIALASAIISESARSGRSRDPIESQSPVLIQMPFASGGRSAVRLVVSNNQADAVRPAVQLGSAEMLTFGKTPHLWTRYPRALLRGLQKNLFTTTRMRLLIAIGTILLALAGRPHALATLTAVPIYYLITHSPFSTEYRYILAIHYFLFMMAAVALFCFWMLLGQACALLEKLIKSKQR
jgi:hypothetical protein